VPGRTTVSDDPASPLGPTVLVNAAATCRWSAWPDAVSWCRSTSPVGCAAPKPGRPWLPPAGGLLHLHGCPVLPPSNSRRMWVSMSHPAECVSENIRCWPQRSQVIRMNHNGNARNGSSRASAPVGRRIHVAIESWGPLEWRSLQPQRCLGRNSQLEMPSRRQ